MSENQHTSPRRKAAALLGKIGLLVVIACLIVAVAVDHQTTQRICNSQAKAFGAVHDQINNSLITLQTRHDREVSLGQKQAAADDKKAIDRTLKLRDKINAVEC